MSQQPRSTTEAGRDGVAHAQPRLGIKRSVGTIAAMLAGATALVGPAVAERSALTELRHGLAHCSSDSDGVCGGAAQIDIDWEGLRLWHPWREHRGLRVEATEVAIMLDGAGVWVDAHALEVSRAMSPEPPRDPAPNTTTKEPTATEPTRPRRSPLNTRGVPVHIRAHGPLSLTHAGVELTLDDPRIELDGHGSAIAEFGLAVSGRGLRAHGSDRWTAHATDGDPRRWRAEGTMQIAEGTAVPAVFDLRPSAIDATLHDGVGGRLYVRAPLPTQGRRPASVSVDAEHFSLAALGSLGQRTQSAWGIDASGAVIDASVSASGLDPHDDRGEFDVGHLTFTGLVVAHPKLARAPVALDTLDLEGLLSWSGEHDLGGELWLSHRGARLTVQVQRGEHAFDLHTELASLPCQELLDAFPAAMTEMIAGMRLRGEIEGHADVHVDRIALAKARAEPDRRPDAPAPGMLSLSFPFLERCTVVQDDPRLDLAALSMAYRHRFIDDRGRPQRRVMAPGGPGFVSLRDARLMARAFITLEDHRFWRHDGFDRDSMHKAFWHNVVKGRVSRGASTISQQAARNLWLGVDRSWGRKLQEALLTSRLEVSTDKARIMELYLNVIELGPGTHGVDEAAQLYFGKPVTELSVLQAVHLASMAPAPSRYSERFIDGHVDAVWLDKLHDNVRRMHRAGHISRGQMVRALRDDLELLDRS